MFLEALSRCISLLEHFLTPLTRKAVSALGLVRGRGPQDTSHCEDNDAGDCGKDGAKRKFCSERSQKMFPESLFLLY